jgi:hypothetical protein
MQQVDVDLVEDYKRDGYVVRRGVLELSRVEELRREARRLLEMCTKESERYAARIEWEVDHLAEPYRAGMKGVIRKLEPVSDLSPPFAELAAIPPSPSLPSASSVSRSSSSRTS